MRNELREKNLHDTEEPAERAAGDPGRSRSRRCAQARTIDGTYNDLHFPKMGAAGRRFGRNFPLEQTFPDTPNLLIPNPRVVSRELMTREQFQPATILNLLAAAWIQFMVHDWFVHKRSETDVRRDPDAAGRRLRRAEHPRAAHACRTPAPAGSTRPPAYVNHEQPLVGCVADLRLRRRPPPSKLRTKIGGKLRMEPTGLLPVDPETGVHFTGFTDNWWIGLAMLHTLFTLEHNYHLRSAGARAPRLERRSALRTRARLINSALMAKIHTVEWTIAIVPHPVIKRAMNVNWSGLAGEDLQEALTFLDDKELLGGIVGSKRRSPQRAVLAHRGVRRRSTGCTRSSPTTSRSTRWSPDGCSKRGNCRRSPGGARRRSPSASRCRICSTRSASRHPGAVTLHNFPRHLQNLTLRQRRASRSGGRGHLPRPRARRAALQPVPPPAAQAAGQVVRRAHRQPGMAQADQGRSTTATSRRWI